MTTPDTGSLEVTWAATSYRYYLARYAASMPPFARSLACPATTAAIPQSVPAL